MITFATKIVGATPAVAAIANPKAPVSAAMLKLLMAARPPTIKPMTAASAMPAVI